jgi:hypothetical protein
LEAYSISTFTYCAAASQRRTTGALWYLIEHMDPMTSPSRWEQPRTASLDSEAKVRLTAHLPVMSQKSVNFEPAGYSLTNFKAKLCSRTSPQDHAPKGPRPHSLRNNHLPGGLPLPRRRFLPPPHTPVPLEYRIQPFRPDSYASAPGTAEAARRALLFLTSSS